MTRSSFPSAFPESPARHLGLVGATAVGLGAIVGGGILVLAGEALRLSGPSSLVAFALNGVVAVLTALSFAEMSTAMPESGGAYMCAKKVLSVRAAFVVGWVLWFAYIVGGVLYALGFVSYAVAGLEALGLAPTWLLTRSATVVVATFTIGALAGSLVRTATGGAEWATWGKLAVLGLIVVIGLAAWPALGVPATTARLTPFFTHGAAGVVQTMGVTFIAIQGFEVIATIAGEVKDPVRTLPRAMLLALAAALAIYLPLLFVVSTVGVPNGSHISVLSAAHPETIVADAVGNFLGPLGFAFVTVAALLATLSALHACILAASRVTLAMAQDRTVTARLGEVHPVRGTPYVAIATSAVATIVVLLLVPDLGVAGAAASLVFLIAFTLAHGTAYLARVRGSEGLRPGFRAPFFPAVPLLGGLACLGLALYQAIAVPAASVLILGWLLVGAAAYWVEFGKRAARVDARAEANDPELARLRGRSPLVLVPIANPEHAPALVAVAAALAPTQAGRVLLLVVVPERQLHDDEDSSWHRDPVRAAQDVLGEALRAALGAGHRPEALLTIAPSPWEGIARVARAYRCQALLVGRSRLAERSTGSLEQLLNDVDADVTFLTAPPGWRLDAVRRILVPTGGRALHSDPQARVLGSLCRTGERTVTWLRVLPEGSSSELQRRAERELRELADDLTPGVGTVDVAQSSDFVAAVLDRAERADLLILGARRELDGRRGFGDITPRITQGASCAVLLISRGA